MPTKTKILFGFFAVLLIGRGAAFIQPKAPWPDRADIKKIRNSIGKDIRQKGAEGAYEELKSRYGINQPHASVIPHLAAHLFGELLYKHREMEGLGVCDASFTYGCFHGLFNAVIAEKGIGSINELFKICPSLPCQHGLGHGLGEYYGPENIETSLNACVNMGAPSIPFGCVGGVMMEYNFPSMFDFISSSADVIRKFNPESPYAPCERVHADFRRACYLRLTEWWEVVMEKDYVRMGELCGLVGEEEYRNSCFMGIGAALITTNGFNVEQSRQSCGLIPSDQGKRDCLVGASFILKTIREEDGALAICDQKCHQLLDRETRDFLRIN